MTIRGIFLSGTTEDGSRHYQSVFDTRVQVAARFTSKEALERAQLEKYRLDHLLRFGSVPFEGVARGGEPPDFIVRQAQNSWRIDCAALVLQSRCQAEALFNRLVQRLAERGNSAWTNLESCNSLIKFLSPSQLPPAKNNTSLDAEIEAALTSIVVDHDRWAQFSATVAAEGFPSQWPSDVGPSSLWHEYFYLVANPIPGWQPRDQLAATFGFHLNLSFPVTLHEVESEVNQMVSQHDNSETQQLLLSVGGPDLNGYRYPAENILGVILRERSIQQVEAHHLERGTAHVWESGDIIDIPVVKPI